MITSNEITSKGQCLRMTWDGGLGMGGGELIPPHICRKVPFSMEKVPPFLS